MDATNNTQIATINYSRKQVEKNNMSKAPEHFRPFDATQARMGAPFGCKNGDKSTVTIWTDARLTGYVEDSMGFHGLDWHANGDALRNEWFRGCDLVMLPLGMCEGKPVFVGDKLEWAHMGRREPVLATPEMRDMDDLTWPRPEPKYPKTRMSDDDLRHAVGMNHNNMTMTVPHLFKAANAAIARACEDGDVVPAAMLEKVAHEAWVQCCAKVRIEILADGSCNVGAPAVPDDFSAIIKRVKEGQ